ncbi:MAG: hypothetical protein ABW352_05980 [Polyangiales bacterium]
MGRKVWWLAALSVTASAQAQPADGAARRRDAGVAVSTEPSTRERTYMSQMSLVIDGARRLITFCEQHGDDKDLARFARPLAERHVELANRMLPSSRLAVAHPHMLLVVENIDRALDSAAAGDAATYQKRLRIARDELANLEAVLKQLKLRVQEPAR